MTTLPEASAVEKQLQELIDPLRKLADELAEQEADLMEQLTKLRAERGRVGAALRAILPPEPKPDVEKINYGNQSVTISAAKVAEVREAVREFDGQWTTNDVRRVLPHFSQDTARKALFRLRETGEVRLMSVKRGRGGSHTYVTTPKGKAAENGST